jgi:hypothetical protein
MKIRHLCLDHDAPLGIAASSNYGRRTPSAQADEENVARKRISCAYLTSILGVLLTKKKTSSTFAPPSGHGPSSEAPEN